MPHEYSAIPSPKHTINDLPRATLSEIRNYTPALALPSLSSSVGSEFLSNILRPCLYRAVNIPNPLHISRVASTVDLLQFFSPEQIAGFYEQLQWLDWSKPTTLYQIRTLSKYKTYSCGYLRLRGLCLFEDINDCPHKNGKMYDTTVPKILEKA